MWVNSSSGNHNHGMSKDRSPSPEEEDDDDDDEENGFPLNVLVRLCPIINPDVDLSLCVCMLYCVVLCSRRTCVRNI